MNTENPHVETLDEELIFEDEMSSAEDPTAETVPVRTAAFLVDGRTSTFLLAETIEALVSRQQIQSAIVDIYTEAGVATATQLLESGVDYRIFDTVPPKSEDTTLSIVERVRSRSLGVVPFDPGDIASIDANIVLIPAPAGDAGAGIDATDGTITAVAMDQLKAAELSCLLVLPPESGLRRQDDGSFVRLTLRLAE